MTPVYMSIFGTLAYISTKPIHTKDGKKADYVSTDISDGQNLNGRYSSKEVLEIIKLLGQVQLVIVLEEIVPKSTKSWFHGMEQLTGIIDMYLIDMSEVQDSSLMFFMCRSLEEINFQETNLYKLKNMDRMFCDCESLQKILFSEINTKNMSMEDTFNDCLLLKDIYFEGNTYLNEEFLETIQDNNMTIHCSNSNLEDLVYAGYYIIVE